MRFPHHRPRRLRQTEAMRRLVRESRVGIDDLVAPLFIKEGIDDPHPIESIPGHVQHTLESIRKEVAALRALDIPAVILFGIPAVKDALGSMADARDGIGQRALSEVRDEVGDDMVVIADLCLDEYTDHGHCGVLDARGAVDNDATLERYRSIARAQAAAGAHLVAPSGMMDGQVGAIRDALDQDGRSEVGILAYAAKFASAFYGPFREAAECAPRFGDRTGYQMDVSNADEAVREAALDVEEGADIVMVKPAMPSLDVIRAVKDATRMPVAAYQVSGEYAALVAAAERGWLDRERVVWESLTAIRRAGADLILTYFAAEAARALADA